MFTRFPKHQARVFLVDSIQQQQQLALYCSMDRELFSRWCCVNLSHYTLRYDTSIRYDTIR